MLNTSGIVARLPVHPGSLVFISRPLPSIPGVPSNTTTVPPVFALSTTNSNTTSDYENREQKGFSPELPYGYTYLPSSGANRVINSADPNDAEDPPPGMTWNVPSLDLIDSKNVPVGFLVSCPYPGYDSSKPSTRSTTEVSAIYEKGSNVRKNEDRVTFSSSMDEELEIPDGYTSKRHPILWPSHAPNLSSAVPTSDFLVGAPVMIDILLPDGLTYQQILCRVVSVDRNIAEVRVKVSEKSERDESKTIFNGCTLNIFVRSRLNPTKWSSVHLEVVDDDVREDITHHTTHSRLPTSSALASDPASSVISGETPIPAGYNLNNEAYFAPPL